MSSEILNPTQVAKHLNVHRSTVVRWIRRGILKADNVGKRLMPRYRISLHAIVEARPAIAALHPGPLARDEGQHE